MEIQREEHGRKGAFFIDQDGEWIAELTYVKSGPDRIVIDHTEVDEEHRHKGLGTELVKRAVEYARENNIKIRATCPFAKKVIEETDDYRDVLTD